MNAYWERQKGSAYFTYTKQFLQMLQFSRPPQLADCKAMESCNDGDVGLAQQNASRE